MFSKETYILRRANLKKQIKSGLILFLGNDDSSMNYPANIYHYRQDSSFLYYFGLDVPGLAAVIDVDSNEETIFGYDYTVDDIVWMGPQDTLAEKAARIGVANAAPTENFSEVVKKALSQNRQIHYLPQYRHDNIIKLSEIMNIKPAQVNDKISMELIKAVVAQRSYKSDEEIEQIESAIDITYEMYRLAMKQSKPGIYEYEVAGAVEALALSRNSQVSFPIIFSIHGEVLHGHDHSNLMADGRLLVLDSGAESSLHYAADITRTYPVNGKFSDFQKDIYNIVYEANEKSIAMMRPGILFRDIHLQAAKTIADGMKQLGFMKGNTDDAVAAGAHALFFPHGLGHQMGLDVHDMEGLGENNVGYNDKIKRSDQFGLAYLRFGRKLESGLVMTVEPGIYFMPELMGQWKTQNKFTEFINYEKVEQHLGFGGVRIEDDILVTDNGYRILGKKIAKTIDEVEEWCAK